MKENKRKECRINMIADIKGITLEKALELLQKGADVKAFKQRDEELLFDIRIVGFSQLNYIVPHEEDKDSFISFDFYTKDDDNGYIFLKLNEYIEINIK